MAMNPFPIHCILLTFQLQLQSFKPLILMKEAQVTLGEPLVHIWPPLLKFQ